MTKRFSVLVVVASLLYGCSGSNPGLVVGTVGSEQIALHEFEETYAKNNGGWERGAASTLEERERFLELLIRFRLKVQEAYSLGLLQDSSVQDELHSYHTSVATSYMLEKELVEPNLRAMYNKRLEYLRASHILIQMAENPTPEDTLKAYARVMEVIGKIPFVPFDSLAIIYSEDPSAAKNRGDLGFFQAGRMVTDFEDACYALKLGEYTRKPVRTRFGYHVIKLTDRKPHQGSVRISHILKRFNNDLSDSVAVRDSAYALFEKLRNGMDFTTAAQEQSDDQQNAQRGGDLGFYEWAQLPPEIASLVFEHPNQSLFEPTRMPYGYHLLLVTARKAPPTYDEIEKDLRNQYQQTRYADDYEDYVHGLKKTYNLNFDVKLLYEITHAFDSTLTPSKEKWSASISDNLRSKTLFHYGNKTYTVANLLHQLESTDEFRVTTMTVENLERIIERISALKVTEEHVLKAVERHPQFAKLMKEYQDGILLYRLEQEEVWKKVHVNDSLLRVYYEENKENFRFPERVSFVEIHVKSKTLADSLYARILKGEKIEELAAQYTERPGLRERKGVWDLQPYRPNDLSSMLFTFPIDSISSPIAYENGWSIVKVANKEEPRVKTFEETTPDVASKYQEYASQRREQEWIEELKKKHGVTVHKEGLAEAFKRGKSENR